MEDIKSQEDAMFARRAANHIRRHKYDANSALRACRDSVRHMDKIGNVKGYRHAVRLQTEVEKLLEA